MVNLILLAVNAKLIVMGIAAAAVGGAVLYAKYGVKAQADVQQVAADVKKVGADVKKDI